MSATLALLLKQLEPTWKIVTGRFLCWTHGIDVDLGCTAEVIVERLTEVAQESSNGWNNAGTGHSALCEPNYTPEAKKWQHVVAWFPMWKNRYGFDDPWLEIYGVSHCQPQFLFLTCTWNQGIKRCHQARSGGQRCRYPQGRHSHLDADGQNSWESPVQCPGQWEFPAQPAILGPFGADAWYIPW